MLTDFTIIVAFLGAFSFTFFVLGISQIKVQPENIIYNMVSVGANFVTCLVVLGMDSQYSLVFNQFFFWLGMMSLSLLIIVGIMMMRVRKESIYR